MKNNQINILIFPCGSEVSLEINESLKNNKLINIYGGNSVDDHGKFAFTNYHGNFPFITDKKFIQYTSDFVKKNKIQYIFPCMDFVLDFMKKNEKKIGCKILTSCKETTSLCLSKERTYEHFKNIIRTPIKFKSEKQIKKFPVYLKPKIGYGSRNNYKVNTIKELKNLYTEDHLILEYLSGDEFTVDCFTDKFKKLLFVNSRKRVRTLNGICTNSILYKDEKIEEIANKINASIDLNGAWFFQLKKNSNHEYCLLEIAPRIAGSSAISRYIGVNLAELSILNELHDNLKVDTNDFLIETDRSLNTKSKLNLIYKYVYVDLDDTIVVKKKININLIRFLYQCINKKIKIILITKHKGNVNKTLRKYKLQNIFDNIIHIKSLDDKYKYIKNKKSIFIDDSFMERYKIKKHLNIPTFSVDSFDCLID